MCCPRDELSCQHMHVYSYVEEKIYGISAKHNSAKLFFIPGDLFFCSRRAGLSVQGTGRFHYVVQSDTIRLCGRCSLTETGGKKAGELRRMRTAECLSSDSRQSETAHHKPVPCARWPVLYGRGGQGKRLFPAVEGCLDGAGIRLSADRAVVSTNTLRL